MKKSKQFEVTTEDGREGLATVDDGYLTVVGTKGAIGRVQAGLRGLDAHELARRLLAELPSRPDETR
jgi:hypothetical protein